MKNVAIVVFIIFLAEVSNAQTFIEVEENRLILGGKPSLPILKPVSWTDLDSIFQVVIDENIEYRYVNGSCEDRAHYISLLLKKMNVSTGKIWNFAPARISFISKELFQVKDPFGISDTIVNWGYHVAPVFTAKDEKGTIDTLVLDQSFSPNGFISYKDWLNKMNCPRSIYTFTDIDSYLFNSINGLIVYNNNITPPTSNKIPEYLPQIITGDFWQLNPSNDYIQKGLAVNDLALKISSEATKLDFIEKSYLLGLIKNIDNVVAFTYMDKPEEISIQTYNKLVDYYTTRLNYWKNKYIALNE